MAEISRAALFGKLNPVGFRSAESATTLCKLRGNPYVELAHFMNQVFQLQDSDLHRIVDHFSLNRSRLASDLTAALDALPRGATAISDFSPHFEQAVMEGWTWGSLLFGATSIRTGHIVVGAMKAPGLRNVLHSISREFARIKVEELSDRFDEILAGSTEAVMASAAAAAAGAGPGEASGAVPRGPGKQEALARFSVDLTENARRGRIDPVVGRDQEIRQVVDILMRRRQNNPILTGEAGVGKTAVVEGFARRIAAGDVPPPLRDVVLRSLDLGLLQAGASMKGEFEERLKQVIEEVQGSPRPVILFIDEAHTLIGAGGAAGQGDAANLLKPALARGTLRTIAATTWGEYKKHIEKDPALTRRFQVVKVEEPSEERAIGMMRGIASNLERHHRVQILDEALEASVRLSHRYIADRQLPDKCVSLLDTASARVAVSQHATPARVEDCQRGIEALRTELAIVDREAQVGFERGERRAGILAALGVQEARLAELDARWQREKALVDRVLDLRAALRGDEVGTIESAVSTTPGEAGAVAWGGGANEHAAAISPVATAEKTATATATPPADGGGGSEGRTALLDELGRVQADLTAIQGEDPLILPSVDGQAVATVVADWTGIPVGRMVKNEIEAVLGLAGTLERRVLGQRHALDAIARRIQTSRASLIHPGRPVGVFLLVGPSGVGKTETALALAESLYGGEQNLITINMSEFQESHTVSTLKGSPPGYVGYGEGGVMTEAVRRRPYSVVLLDEVEKAHSDVHEVFFQVFDKGWMEDGEGRLIDFKNTIILLTSNVGSDLVMGMCRDPALRPDAEGLAKALRKPLLETFPAALLGRLVVVPFYPLGSEMISSIIRLQIDRVDRRLREHHGVPLEYGDDVVDLIAKRCTEVESGARMIDAILTHTVLPEVSREILSRMLDGGAVAKVRIAVADGDFQYVFE